MTSSVTTDFREEYEAERGRWLRKRFLWYTSVFGAIGLIVACIRVFLLSTVDLGASEFRSAVLQFAANAISTGLYITAYFYARARLLSREQVLRLVTGMLLIMGMLTLVLAPILIKVSLAAPTTEEPSEALKSIQEIAPQFSIVGVAVSYFLACLFIPWTPKEAFRPVGVLVGLYAGVSLASGDAAFWIRVVAILVAPLAFLPGLLVCMWRHSRFRDRFHFKMLKGRYGELKHELGFARQIHESMFPPPVAEGAVRFDYRYEPMRQIGGDYLFARFSVPVNGAEPILTLAIIDVTGHGIGAALTVNRLHGEIEREIGENPSISPGELLTGLNDYLHHTLANHSVYATAIFLRIDPNSGRLKWASAGHPPAFLRTLDGRIERLDSTTLVLGACRGEDFQHNEQSCRFLPGDVLLAYTDGAIEARNNAGRMLTVEGLQRILASSTPDRDGGWAAATLRAVDEHRFGPAQDDTLMVEIYRPVKF